VKTTKPSLAQRARLRFALLLTLAAPGCTMNIGGFEMGPVTFVTQAVPIMAQMAWGIVYCRVGDCSPVGPEGMRLISVANETVPSTPVAFDVDAFGRVWISACPRSTQGVSDNRSKAYWLPDELAAQTVEDRIAYIEKWAADDQGDPLDWYTEVSDPLVLLEDTDGDGQYETSRTLAEYNEIERGCAAGIEVVGEDIYYANIPELIHMRDDDRDGNIDSSEVVEDGFGVKTSLFGHDMHGFAWGPDGKLYWSIGDRGFNITTREGRHLVPPMDVGRGAVFRMNPDGSDIELFATGVRNPQELAFDNYGNLFTGDNNGDGGDRGRLVYIAEGGETGWSMTFQTQDSPYVRGPWIEERLWELQHPNQAAWILPPVAYIANGPAGFAHYPGLGLPERYADHFFLADYRFVALGSLIWSFSVEPKGASFEIADVHEFATSIAAPDIDFGYDGTFYAMNFQYFPPQSQEMMRLQREDGAVAPGAAEGAALFREGFSHRSDDELVSLLSNIDQRARQRAQFELAKRGVITPLARLAEDADAELLPRLHAVWGLGQQGRDALAAAGWTNLRWAAEAPLEVRAQLAKIAGETGAVEWAPDLRDMLSNAAPRVRYHAAISLGKLRDAEAVPLLIEGLRSNADADVFLRHAFVFALAAFGDAEIALRHADDTSRSVRLGALLILRRLEDARIADFLSDTDPYLVVEAARAIYDLPLDNAMDELGALAITLPLDMGDDEGNTFALHRRVIGANLRLGSEAGANRLAAHASNPANPERMRRIALDALANYTAPQPRDLANSYWRPLPERPTPIVYAALDRYGLALLASDLDAEAMKVALKYGRVPLSNSELAAIVADSEADPALRASSLDTLAMRSAPQLDHAIATGLDSTATELRIAARAALATQNPEAALASIADLPSDAPVAEAQNAYRVLAALGARGYSGADQRLAEDLDRLTNGALRADVALDLVEAAETRDDSLKLSLDTWRGSLPTDDPLAPYRTALEGGDAGAGKATFSTAGDCLRCHSVASEGGVVGPPLTNIGSLLNRERLLESVIEPNTRLAPGYATISVELQDGTHITGTLQGETDAQLSIAVDPGHGEPILSYIDKTQIANQTTPASAMPPMGRVLPLRDLRNLIEYLATLR